MNGIFGKAHRSDKSQSMQHNRQQGAPVETAGSLAMWQQSLLMASVYDSFSTANPFAVDYSAYGMDASAGMDFTAGILSAFSNAMSVLGDGAVSGSFSGGGFAGGGGFSGGGGGFSSVC